jgi:hypothetical protein
VAPPTRSASHPEGFSNQDLIGLCASMLAKWSDRIDRMLAMDVLRMGRLRAVDIHPVERKPAARQ